MSNKPKYKICKQVGLNIWGTKKKIKAKKNRSSLYHQLFKHKKILKTYYGNLSENYFYKVYNKSKKNASYKNDPIRLLERRLDIILVRLNWAQSIFEAKQLILHGHILVNGIKVTYRNHLINPGDIIQIKQNSIKNIVTKLEQLLQQQHLPKEIPNYLEINYNVMSAILLYIPKLEEIPYPVKLNPYTIKHLYKV